VRAVHLWTAVHPQFGLRSAARDASVRFTARVKILLTVASTSIDHAPHRIRRAVKGGGVRRLHRGAYLDLEGLEPEKVSAETDHAARTYGVAHASSGVVSGVSAANLHGLPLLDHRLAGGVMLTRPTRGTATAGVVVRRSRLRDDEVMRMHGMRVTTLERTVRDLAEYLEPHEMLAVADAAMRQGFDPKLLPMKGRHSRIFRWLAEHASPRSESFAESWCRALIIEAGMPPPLLQVSVYDEQGRFIGRVDFAWPECGLILEFDGRVKYGAPVADGKKAADIVMREKQRERGLIDAGWFVSRGVWQTLSGEGRLLEQLRGDWRRAAKASSPIGTWKVEPLSIAPPKGWSHLFGAGADA